MVVDKQLIADCKQQDERAQRELYQSYSPVLFGICLRYCQNREEAEDLLQEGFLTIFTKIDQFSGNGSFIGWMRRIIINTVLMSYRKKSDKDFMISVDEVNQINLSNVHTEETIEPEASPENVKEMIKQSDFSQEELLQAVAQLPEGYRIVFNLAVIEGYKHREIAGQLGISESTSKSQLLRARKQLQKILYKKCLDKKKNKRKLVYAFAFLGMNEDFNYIDEILKKGFDNLKVPPGTDWAALSSKLGAAKTSAGTASAGSGTASGLKSGISIVSKVSTNVVSYISSNLMTFVSVLTASVISMGVITSSSTIDTVVASGQPNPASIVPVINNDLQDQNYDYQSNIPESEIPESEIPADENNFQNSNDISSEQSPEKETIYDTIKVPVVKTIYKTKIIRDTIRKTKPVIIN